MKKQKFVAGSGRGNKNVAVIDDPTRPECHKCGGFMISKGKRWKCKTCNYFPTKTQYLKRRQREDFFAIWGFNTEAAEKHAAKCENYKRVIVTSAQNNTSVFEPFFESLKTAAEHFRCPLAVIPVHYKNISLYERPVEKFWVKEVQPYLVKGDIQFGNILIRPDMKISATAINPLQGKQAHGGNNWVVFGHGQVACEPVPSPGDILPKRLYTTGSCTQENYTITDLGERARFHHSMGALLIEKCGDKCFVRQLLADDKGHFYDLDKLFTPTEVIKDQRALSLTPGDEHEKFNIVKDETYLARNSIVKVTKPEVIVRHDVLDGYAGSHHHKTQPLVQFKKHHNGDSDYRAELDACVEFINKTTPKGTKTVIVPSNHHDHLDKYLATADANKDHQNAILICELQAEMRKAALAGEKYDPFYLYLKDRLTCDFEFLDRNMPYLLGGVDHSQHGDVGANGARGSASALARSTYKMTIGHSHSARICKGVYQSGTSTGRLEYERGLSTHTNTHVLQYQNGKRTLIDIIDGKWRA